MLWFTILIIGRSLYPHFRHWHFITSLRSVSNQFCIQDCQLKCWIILINFIVDIIINRICFGIQTNHSTDQSWHFKPIWKRVVYELHMSYTCGIWATHTSLLEACVAQMSASITMQSAARRHVLFFFFFFFNPWLVLSSCLLTFQGWISSTRWRCRTYRWLSPQ